MPVVHNKTAVLILQHVRERFHPFNTARIVHRGLKNSCLLVDHTKNMAASLHLLPRAGLLYPGAEATLISDLSAEQRPEQLVVLDGTWHHAKTLIREIPALRALPRYRLLPAAPSRYRIRREPSAVFLSTVEATVAALQALEPETIGLEQLLKTFDAMVERQLAHPKSPVGWRRKKKHHRNCGNLPAAIIDKLDNIVVAYGESALGQPDDKRHAPSPVNWVAQRLGSDERFACTIQPTSPLTETMLGHFELTQQDFRTALSPDDACAAWAAFLRRDDVLVVYSQGTARLLASLNRQASPCLVLKSVDFNQRQRYATLDELIAAEGLTAAPAQFPGRAGKRLANAIALVRHLHALGHANRDEETLVDVELTAP